MITGVAIKVEGKMYFASKPYRHNDLIKMAVKDYCKPPINTFGDNSGFITDTGGYLPRDKAETYARIHGQLTGALKGSVLTSEDLW